MLILPLHPFTKCNFFHFLLGLAPRHIWLNQSSSCIQRCESRGHICPVTLTRVWSVLYRSSPCATNSLIHSKTATPHTCAMFEHCTASLCLARHHRYSTLNPVTHPAQTARFLQPFWILRLRPSIISSLSALWGFLQKPQNQTMPLLDKHPNLVVLFTEEEKQIKLNGIRAGQHYRHPRLALGSKLGLTNGD